VPSPSTADLLGERPDVDVRLEAELGTRMTARLRLMCQLALVLVPVFFALDLMLFPAEVVVPLLAIRCTMMFFSLASLLALRTAIGRRWVTALSLFLVWQAGFGVILMTVVHGGASSGYYAGVNLVMLAAAVLMPWGTTVSLVAAVALIGSYIGACVAWSGIPEPAVFAQNLFFLASTALIMVVSHRTIRLSLQREIRQRMALEEAGRHRDEFLANITHELRTPLSAILGFTEMLVDYMPDATVEQRTWLTRIRDNALTLYRLIVQLLDFSKIEAGALELAREPVRLDAIVTKVADDMRAIARELGTEVATSVPSVLPVVTGDPGRVEEIVSNLAANALKFSGGRPIHLDLRVAGLDRTPAWQRVVPDPGPASVGRRYAEIAVGDTGTGIRPEDLRRLFVAFLQLDGSSTRRHEGTGLGLAISARLAAAMGGHIAVHSVPGQGSTFALLLPVDESVASAQPTGGADETGAPPLRTAIG
jgi:signal transduction histidine kinase